MSIDFKWTESDPESGERRFYEADRFAGVWRFRVRDSRRGDSREATPTPATWEKVLDVLERRYRRREGVTDADLDQVRKILAEFHDAPTAD